MKQILLLVMLLPSTIFGFELMPEYNVLSEIEVVSIESPELYDSEYESDYLTYWPSYWLRNSYKNSNRVFSYSIGSLSGNEFMIMNHLKLHTAFDGNKFFKFNFSSESQKTDQQNNNYVELGWTWNKDFSASLVGQAFYHKRNNDFGLLLSKRLSQSKTINFMYLKPDFVRNTNSDQQDNFKTAPQSIFISLDDFDRGNWSEMYVRIEPWVEWNWPQLSSVYFFERYVVGYDACFELDNAFCIKSYFRQKYESMETVANANWSRVREYKLLLTSFDHRPLKSWFYNMKLGVYFVHREFQLPSGNSYISHVLPHVDATMFEKNKHKWNLGFDMTLFLSKNTSADVTLQPDAVESRMNLKYFFKYSKNANLSLSFTFDLDELASETAWEGGAGEFMMFF